jgi:hypothetical protein
LQSIPRSLRLVMEAKSATVQHAVAQPPPLGIVPLFPITHSLSHVTLSLNHDLPPLMNMAEALRQLGALGTRHPPIP